MKFRLLIISFVVTLLPAVVEAPHQVASVEVLAFDTMGGTIPSDNLNIRAFEQLGSNKDYAPKFHNGRAKDMPFGYYRIKANYPGFNTEERIVRIFQDKTTIVIGLTVGVEGCNIGYCPPPELWGRVIGEPEKLKNAFVKVAGVFTSYSAESQINPDGEFHVTEPPGGVYVLLVVSQDAVIVNRIFRLPPIPYGSPLQVEIGPEP